MTDVTMTVEPRRRRCLAGRGARAWVMTCLLGVALLVQGAAAAPAPVPGRDPQRKVLPPTRVAPRFNLGDGVRDPFLPSATLLDSSASSGGNKTGVSGAVVTPPVSVKTGPVTWDEVVAAVMVQGFYQAGTQVVAMVNGNPVQAGAVMTLMVRGQACPVNVMAIDALAQKVLLKYEGQVFERNLNPGRPSGGGAPGK